MNSTRSKKKVDCKKCFVLVDNLQQFDALPSHLPPERRTLKQAREELRRKYIALPAMKIVPRVCAPKQHALIPPNYIRTPADLGLPSTHYELAQSDIELIQRQSQQFYHRGVKVLTAEFLRGAIEWLELETFGRDIRGQAEERELLLKFVQEQYSHFLCMPDLDDLVGVVLGQWRERRDSWGMPLLRELWKQDKVMGIFKQRTTEKMVLRGDLKMVETEALEEREREMLMGLQLSEGVAQREAKKLTLSFLNFTSLYYETQDLAGINMDDKRLNHIKREQVPSFDRESARKRIRRTADIIRTNLSNSRKDSTHRQDQKHRHHQKGHKDRKDGQDRQNYHDRPFSPQNSILHFLATVIAEAHKHQIDQESLLPELSQPQQQNTPPPVQENSQTVGESQPAKQKSQPAKEKKPRKKREQKKTSETLKKSRASQKQSADESRQTNTGDKSAPKK